MQVDSWAWRRQGKLCARSWGSSQRLAGDQSWCSVCSSACLPAQAWAMFKSFMLDVNNLPWRCMMVLFTGLAEVVCARG